MSTTFTLPALPYAYDALGPYMSKETLEFHHDKHHQAYVTNGNKLLEGSGLEILALEDRFGLSPKAALGLGIQPLTPGRTLEDLNIAATLSAAEDPGEDPRDALIEWQAEQARARRGETDAQEG